MPEHTDRASPAMLREVARNFDASAEFCDSRNPAYPDLAARDRGIAASLRFAADVVEREANARAH